MNNKVGAAMVGVGLVIGSLVGTQTATADQAPCQEDEVLAVVQWNGDPATREGLRWHCINTEQYQATHYNKGYLKGWTDAYWNAYNAGYNTAWREATECTYEGMYITYDECKD